MGPWDIFMVDSVTFQTLTPVKDTSGDSPNGTPSTGTALFCSAQPAAPDRIVQFGAEQEVASHTLYFAVEPLDTSSGARADGRCKLKDLFLWAFDPTDVTRIKTLYALGLPVKQPGFGVMWAVDCVLVD